MMNGGDGVTVEELAQIGSDLSVLAREIGADDVAAVAASDVVVDERVRLKCLVPLCASYGRNLVCPPRAPSPAETRVLLQRYRLGLVVQQAIPYTQADADQFYGGRTHAEAHAAADGQAHVADGQMRAARRAEMQVAGQARAEVAGQAEAPVARGDGGARAGDGYESIAAASQNGFAALMTRLESAAFKRGLRFAAAFGGGDCKLCETCVGQGSDEPCRHPFEARPSMEALGIDVIATAANAGLRIEMPAIDAPRWTGLLLLD
jgi:predicted metal-binding protein